MVHQWFTKVEENPAARQIWEADVAGFAEKVRHRAVEKRAEEAAAKKRQDEALVKRFLD